MKNLLSTKEVAQLLDVNEKMVYTLVSEKDRRRPKSPASGFSRV